MSDVEHWGRQVEANVAEVRRLLKRRWWRGPSRVESALIQLARNQSAFAKALMAPAGKRP